MTDAVVSVQDDGEGIESPSIAWQNYMAALERELEEAKKDVSTELLRTYTSYANHKSRVDSEAKRIAQKMAQISDAVIAAFQDNALEKWTSNGRTLSLRRELWAGHQEDQKENLLEALKAAGLHEYVSEGYNTMSLSAFVREADPDSQLTPEEIIAKLPPEIQPFIKVSEKIKIGHRKA